MGLHVWKHYRTAILIPTSPEWYQSLIFPTRNSDKTWKQGILNIPNFHSSALQCCTHMLTLSVPGKHMVFHAGSGFSKRFFQRYWALMGRPALITIEKIELCYFDSKLRGKNICTDELLTLSDDKRIKLDNDNDSVIKLNLTWMTPSPSVEKNNSWNRSKLV